MTDESALLLNDDLAERLAQCYARLIELGQRRRARLEPQTPDVSVAGRPSTSGADDAPTGGPDAQGHGTPCGSAVQVREVQRG